MAGRNSGGLYIWRNPYCRGSHTSDLGAKIQSAYRWLKRIPSVRNLASNRPRNHRQSDHIIHGHYKALDLDRCVDRFSLSYCCHSFYLLSRDWSA